MPLLLLEWVQLEEHDRQLLLDLKETMASRKMELHMAEIVATKERGKQGLFAPFLKNEKKAAACKIQTAATTSCLGFFRMSFTKSTAMINISVITTN